MSDKLEFFKEDKMMALKEARHEKDRFIKDALERYAMYCDHKIAQILSRRRALGVLTLVLAAFFIGGCHTASSFGDLLKGAGTDIKNVSEGYLEENR